MLEMSVVSFQMIGERLIWLWKMSDCGAQWSLRILMLKR
jgi:hypothetical protein